MWHLQPHWMSREFLSFSFYKDDNETSAAIATHVKDILNENGLSIDNVSGYVADNASVNFGKHNSVYQSPTNHVLFPLSLKKIALPKGRIYYSLCWTHRMRPKRILLSSIPSAKVPVILGLKHPL